MNKLRALKAHQRWLEMFNQPLVTMRQELVGLIRDEKTEV
jgi:hypothetical protein